MDLCRHYRTTYSNLQEMAISTLGQSALASPLRHSSKECEEMKKDLSCFTVFPEKFNGKVMYTQEKHQYNVFLDACLTGDGAF